MISDGSFSKKERLVKTGDFKRVYKVGRSFKRDFLVMKIAANNLPLNRIGFSISARIVKKASWRNRIKRIFREVFRRNKRTVKNGRDIALIFKRDPGRKLIYVEAQKIYLGLFKEATGL